MHGDDDDAGCRIACMVFNGVGDGEDPRLAGCLISHDAARREHQTREGAFVVLQIVFERDRSAVGVCHMVKYVY